MWTCSWPIKGYGNVLNSCSISIAVVNLHMDSVNGFPSTLYTATPAGSFIVGVLNFTRQGLAAKCDAVMTGM